MLLSFLLFFIFILGCLYIHNYLMDNKTENMSLNRSRNKRFGNYHDILTATPAHSVIYDEHSIISFDDDEEEDDDDNSIISFDTIEANDSCIDPEQVMNMPSGYDPLSKMIDSATYDFSSNKQMRVFQKPDFVKQRRNNRVVVDTNNNRELENQFSQESYSSLHSQFQQSYMDGVVPYDG
jgi:hypothetical protein